MAKNWEGAPRMTRRGPNRSTEGSRLYHEAEIRRRMLRAYYGVLNRQPQFRAALRGLLEQVGLLPVPVLNALLPNAEAKRLLYALIQHGDLPRHPPKDRASTARPRLAG